MSNLNVDNIAPSTPGGVVDFSGPIPPTFLGSPLLVSTSASAPALLATPSISGTRVLSFNNASLTTVTSFTGGASNQEFYVRSGNTNTTLQHNANIRLLGATNKTIGVDDTLLFLMNTAGTVATQVI